MVFCVKRERSRCVRGVVVVDSVVIVGRQQRCELDVLCVAWADRQCDGKCVLCVCVESELDARCLREREGGIQALRMCGVVRERAICMNVLFGGPCAHEPGRNVGEGACGQCALVINVLAAHLFETRKSATSGLWWDMRIRNSSTSTTQIQHRACASVLTGRVVRSTATERNLTAMPNGRHTVTPLPYATWLPISTCDSKHLVILLKYNTFVAG